MNDLLIKNGRVVDGSGQASFVGDVAIKDGTIVGTGRISDGAARTIDANGLTVAPGFVDMHTHYDAQIFWDPLLTSSCWNGVTSVVAGNCGFTLAPCQPRDQEYLARTLGGVEAISPRAIQEGVPFNWTSYGEFMNSLDAPRGINIATNVGHTSIRRFVMGDHASDGPATNEEIAKMCGLVREALDAGAFCFTTSRAPSHWGPSGEPVPSRMATLEELYKLCMELKGFWNCGLEMIGPQYDAEGRDWMVRVSKELACQINWNEFNDRPNDPEAFQNMQAYMEDANRQGARIYGVSRCQQNNMEFDLRENTIMITMYPGWAEVMAAPLEEKKRLLADPEVRTRLKDGIENPPAMTRMDWNRAAVWETVLDQHRELEGRSLADIAKERGHHPVDVMLDIGLEENLVTEFAMVANFSENRDRVGEVLKSPYSILGISDAGAHLNTFCGAMYTTFFLKNWVRERQAFTLEEGIRKLTFSPASIIGLRDRGLLRAGMAGDVTIFDAETVGPREARKVRDLPGGEGRIIAEADGIHYVVVGGQVLLEDGKHTGALPGRLLRSGDYR